MEFDKSRVYTALNADELKAGDKVIVADDLFFLKALVERGSQLNTIDEIYDENCQCRFVVEGYDYVYSLAYLVERKSEKHFRPYKDTDEEKAEEYADSIADSIDGYEIKTYSTSDIEQAYLAGLKAGRPKWHKVFENDPYYNEYWDLPQDRLPKIENFYFVKLKNGFIKICELKYDHWSGKKCFYDLHGGKQSNIAEWLDYPTIQGE